MLFWLMGDLSFAPFSAGALCMLLAVGALAVAGARSLNVPDAATVAIRQGGPAP
jgi:hypothetical protein